MKHDSGTYRGALPKWTLCLAVMCGCSVSEYGVIAASRTGDLSLGPAPRAPFDDEVTQACGSGGVTVDGAHEILRQPYLQQVQAGSATVLWTSSSDAGGAVVVRSSAGARSSPAVLDEGASRPESFQYSAALRELETDTLYCYEVRGAGDVPLASAGFRTAPLPGARETVRFVAVGDSGKRSVDQAAVLGAMRLVPFELMVHVGDAAGGDGTLGELERNFFDPYADVLEKIPFFVSIGNHDYYTDRGAPFREALEGFENGGPEAGELWYSFDWGDIHWVVLNTNRIVPEQLAWLDRDLQETRRRFTIVALHHSPFTSGHHGSDERVRAALVPLFAAHKVPLVLSGHDHHYERTHPLNGVTYIVTGGGGQGTRDVGHSSFTAFAVQVAHFIHGEVSGDALTIRAIDGIGKEFDSVLIRANR